MMIYNLYTTKEMKQQLGAGTEPYSSPEVLLLNRTIDHKVDVWSFGMTLYEMWSGIVPWRVPGNPGEMLFQSIHEALREKKRPFLEISSISTGLKKMIAACWSEEASDRLELCLCIVSCAMASLRR